jgi:hypothetical protein
MTSEQLQQALQQNRENLKALLAALDADYQMPEDPETQAKMAAMFGGSAERAKEAELSEEERAAWLFEENTKALLAAAKAAGVSEREAKAGATEPESGLGQLFNPSA